MGPLNEAASSSSSAAGPAPCASAEAAAPIVLAPVGDKLHIALDPDLHEGSWVLTSSITMEQCRVDAPGHPPWMLGYDDDCSAFCCNAKGEEVWLPSDKLGTSVYRAGGRHLLVWKKGGDGSDIGKVWADQLRWHYRFSKVVAKVSLANATVCLPVVILEQARLGNVIFWSLPGVAKAANFNCCQRGIGIWAQKGWTCWLALCQACQLPGQLIKSQAYTTKDEGPMDTDRQLPFNSASTAALLALLSTRSSSTREHGGLKYAEDRARALSILGALLQPLATRDAVRLKIFMGKETTYRWPRPPAGTHPAILYIDAGVVDVSRPLQDASLTGQPGKAWSKELGSALGGQRQVSILEFLRAAFSRRKGPLQSLCCQVVQELGALLDTALAAASQIGELCAGLTISTPELDLDNACQLELDLVRYREGSLQEAAGGHLQYLSCPTDKSRVFGMGIANCCFVKPNNKAWWGCPSVPPTAYRHSQPHPSKNSPGQEG